MTVPTNLSNSVSRLYLCVDLGGTKIAAGIVDAANGRVLARAAQSTPAEAGSTGGLAVALATCNQALRMGALDGEAVRGIGISFGGPVDPDGSSVLRSMHISAWENVPLPKLLSEQFQLPAAMENDGNAAALAEWLYGVGRGSHSLFYVQLSTGIGSGLVLEGELYRGAGGAAEFGHVVVDPDGPQCSCGQRGCLESVAAGWALARDAHAFLAARPGVSSMDAEFVMEQARAGDFAAKQIVARAFSSVGVSLASAINLLDPDLIVLGGGMVKANDLLLPWLHVELDRHVLPHLRSHARVELSKLGADAPLIGAAATADFRIMGKRIAGFQS
jgi:glucokinase